MDCICDKFVMVEDGEVFEMSQAAKGDPGPGVAPGGTTGQILAKASDTDYDTEWIDPPDLDAGHVEYDPAETYDDGSVGKELTTINSALSSLSSVTEIIDTASGAIASFPDGSGLPMRSLVAQINPVQDLHGYANPWPAGGGKNKYDMGKPSATVNGVAYTRNSDGSYTAVGTATAASVFKGQDIELKAGTYMMSALTTGSATLNSSLYINNAYYFSVATGPRQFTLENDSVVRIDLYVGVGVTANLTFYPQIEAGTTATSYEPFSNLCPISGHTGLSVEVRGGNLLDKTGAVRGGFDASGNVLVNSGDSRCVTVFLEVKPNVTYYIDKTIPLTQGRAGFWYDENQTAISQISFNGAGASSGAVTSPANAKYCRLGYLATNEDVCTMTVGSSALTPYEPYTSGTTTPVSWQDEAGTVYGGSDEVVGGELTSTMAMVDMGTLTWTRSSSFGGSFQAELVQMKENTAQSICSEYRIVSSGSEMTNADYAVYTKNNGKMIYAKDARYTDAASFKSAVSGVQLVYELATPTTFTHTPTQISTLLGQNNVWHDANGDTTVTYQANLKGYIDKKLA